MTGNNFRRAWGILFISVLMTGGAMSVQDEAQVDKEAAKAEARASVELSFGSAIRSAKSSAAISDNLAVAKRLLELAPSYRDKPALLSLLCENAYQLVYEYSEGMDLAIEAMTLLAQSAPEEAQAAWSNVVTLRRKRLITADRGEKEAAAGLLIDAMRRQGDAAAAMKDSKAALAAYRGALTVASTFAPMEKDAIADQIQRVTVRARAEKMIDTLKAKIKADDPDREAAATELLMLYMVELDDPEAARQYSFLSGDKPLTQRISQITGSIEDLKPEEVREIGEWYFNLGEKSRSTHTKAAMLARAREYYQHFLDHPTENDLVQAGVKLQVEKIAEDLKKLGVKAVGAPPKTRIAKAAPKQVEFDLGDGVKLTLVRITAGEFLIGSPGAELMRRGFEEEQHKVKLTKDYYIGVYEVTQAQYKAVTGLSPSYLKGRPDLPVERVSWHDAVAYCRLLSEKTGRRFRLPTEAEWEFACRAGTTTPFWHGATIDTSEVNYNGNFTYGSGVMGINRGQPIPVGSLNKPNPWGLHDMAGNVWEWCSDWHEDFEGEAMVDPTGPATGIHKICRGGSYSDKPFGCRSAARGSSEPTLRSVNNGFRVVMEVPE